MAQLALLWPFKPHPIESTFPASADLYEKPFSNQIGKVPVRRTFGNSQNLLVLGIRDLTGFLNMRDGAPLSLVQVIASQNLVCQPIAPKGDSKFTAALGEIGFRQGVGETFPGEEDRDQVQPGLAS